MSCYSLIISEVLPKIDIIMKKYDFFNPVIHSQINLFCNNVK